MNASCSNALQEKHKNSLQKYAQLESLHPEHSSVQCCRYFNISVVSSVVDFHICRKISSAKLFLFLHKIRWLMFAYLVHQEGMCILTAIVYVHTQNLRLSEEMVHIFIFQ